MAFEIDEEKLKSVEIKKSSDFYYTISEIAEFFISVFLGLLKVIPKIIVSLIILGVVIFVGGAILGILLFGWRQL